MRVSNGQEWISVHQEADAFGNQAGRRPYRYGPWTRSQVWVADAWPTRRDQPVSVAFSPAGNQLALSVGQRLSVSDITDGSRVQSRLQMACALAPGLTWSPDGDRLAFRDDAGQALRRRPRAVARCRSSGLADLPRRFDLGRPCDRSRSNRPARVGHHRRASERLATSGRPEFYQFSAHRLGYLMRARASRRSGGSGSSAVRMCWPARIWMVR